MGSISAAIELHDHFTGVLMNVISAVTMSVSAMEQMQSTMSDSMDTTSIQGIRDQLTQATVAAQELDAAMQNITPPAATRCVPVKTNSRASSSVPVQNQLPAASDVWQSYEGPEVFTGMGLERFEQEVASANAMLEQLGSTQDKITRQANESLLLSPQASYEIQMVENRIQGLHEKIQQIEKNPFNLGTDTANAGLEKLRGRIDEISQAQGNLSQAMEGMDVSQINQAYLEISQMVSDTERFVRDSFSNILPEDVPPVEIPVTWQTERLEVFTGTGLERFEKEAASATAMLEQLSNTQTRIVRQSYDASVFPPQTFQALNGMATRIDFIRNRIQQIETNPLNLGTETANAGLEQLRSQLNQMVEEQNQLNVAVSQLDVAAAKEAYLRLSGIIGNTERYIRDNTDEQGRFNQQISQGTQEANGLMQSIKGAVAAYATMHTAGSIIELSDTMAQTQARLSLLVDVDDGGSVAELQDMIFLSAERARGDYQQTAEAVSKLGLMAGEAFSGNEEIIAFTEQLNKQFVIAGTEAAGIDAAMLQLTQAMGSGVLRGEEYNSILEQAPNIIQAIADYMNVPIGQLKDMASEGQITAEIVKLALFAAADETNAKFDGMSRTFGQVWNSFRNHALMAFQPVLERLNEIANSESFQGFANHVIGALVVVAGMTLNIFDMLQAGGALLADNWSWISPIIYGVAAALAVYAGYLAITKGIEVATKVGKVALCLASYAHAAATKSEASATAQATAAQYAFNTSLLSSPVTWIIIMIIALIAVFYGVIAAVNHFAGTSISATGLICGVFAMAGAFIGNLFFTLINFVIDLFVMLWNFLAVFANFFANVFNDPIGAIARLFFDLVDTILGLLESLASAIDTIFGSNLAGAVSGWRDSLGGWVDETFGQGEEIMAKVDTSSLHLQRFQYKGAWDAGYSFGQGIDKSIADFDPFSLLDTNIPNPNDYADLSTYGTDLGLSGIGGGVDDIAGNTGAIADSMDMTEEELKYLRDIAEQDTINRFTTAEIKIDMSGMKNTIQGMEDLDGFISGLTDAVQEAADNMVEGVHE